MEGKTELQRNEIILGRRKELETFQRALDIQWLNSRMEDGRMGRCLALIRREADMERDFQERTDHAAIVNAKAAKETALGIEVAKVRREEACELLRRHYLRERDPSLRKLQTKLQAGYVCRDLRLQIRNNEYKRLQEKAEEKRSDAFLLNSLYNNQEADKQEEAEKMKRSTAYCKELQQQLVNRERERQCQYEESLIEKKMLEEIMKTLADEDQREVALKHETMARLRGEMQTSMAARLAWKQKQKEMVVREEREIERQNALASDRTSAIVAERERKIRAKEELNAKIVNKILADEAARMERENIIKTLQEQEYLEKNANDDIAERSKLDRSKQQTKEALTAQMENRKKLAREERQREAELRKVTEAKMAAEEQKEREKVLKKKKQGRLYSQQLLQQVQDNASRRRREREGEAARAQAVWDHHTAWDSEVNKERQELVREHAPQLLGYLQAGVLMGADMAAVGEGAGRSPQLAGLDVRGMAAAARPRQFPKCNAQCMTLRDF